MRCALLFLFSEISEGEEKLALPSRGQGFLRLAHDAGQGWVIHAQQELRVSAARSARRVDSDNVPSDRIEKGHVGPLSSRHIRNAVGQD